MEFVAFVGTDKENWGQITALMNRLECESIFLVMNKDVSGFPTNEKSQIIRVDSSQGISDLKNQIIEKLKPKLKGDFESAVSLASGSGKEHMAFLAALLSVPVGVRIAVYTKGGVQFIT